MDGYGGKVESTVDVDLHYDNGVVFRMGCSMEAQYDGKSWIEVLL